MYSSPQVQTLDATPKVVNIGVLIPESSAGRVSIEIFAKTPTASDVALWSGTFLVRRIGTGAPTAIGSLTKSASAGASAWNAVLTLVENSVQATITGAAGVTIDWLATSSEALGVAGPFPV